METAAAGLLTGLILGPMARHTGVLCVGRARDSGGQAGLLAALGAVLAEAVYALLGRLLAGAAAGGETWLYRAFSLAVAALLLILGVRSLLWPQEDLPPDWEERRPREHVLAGLVVGFSCPGALARFSAGSLLFTLPLGWGEGILWVTAAAAGTLAGYGALVIPASRKHRGTALSPVERAQGGVLCLAAAAVLARGLWPL